MAPDTSITVEPRKSIGRSVGPIVFEVERGAIRRFAVAVGDPNPLYRDEGYARQMPQGVVVAPPGFFGWPLSKTPTTRQLVQWAGASGDFHPIHYDLEFARGEGLPGLIVHGLLKYQFLVQMLSDWVGPAGGVRCKGMDSPGETLTCSGAVVGTRIEVGLRIVDCEVWVENQRGERTTTGSATVWFPAGVGEDW